MKAIKYFLVTMVVFASLCGLSAQAQTPVPAAAPIVSSEQKAAVKALLDAMNFKQMMSQMAGAMSQNMPQMIGQMVATDPSLTAEQKVEARKLSAKSSESVSKVIVDIYNDPKVIQGMEEIMARMYARNFTIDEIKAITAFYVSPAGKKTLTVLPQVMQQTMPEIMGLVTPRVKEAMTKMTADITEQAKKDNKADSAPANK